SHEESKGGFRPEELPPLAEKLAAFAGVKAQGLMTMAAPLADPRDCRPTFVELRELRDKLRSSTNLPLPHLSMRMSNDFEIAIEEGATLVRLGTTLFEGL
ncbi:MAG TPA: alanine racemase, partial [Gemmataceae bacterium]